MQRVEKDIKQYDPAAHHIIEAGIVRVLSNNVIRLSLRSLVQTNMHSQNIVISNGMYAGWYAPILHFALTLHIPSHCRHNIEVNRTEFLVQ